MFFVHKSFIMDADKPAIQVRNPDATHLLRDVYANVLSYWDAKVVNHAYKCQSALILIIALTFNYMEPLQIRWLQNDITRHITTHY